MPSQWLAGISDTQGCASSISYQQIDSGGIHVLASQGWDPKADHCRAVDPPNTRKRPRERQNLKKTTWKQVHHVISHLHTKGFPFLFWPASQFFLTQSCIKSMYCLRGFNANRFPVAYDHSARVRTEEYKAAGGGVGVASMADLFRWSPHRSPTNRGSLTVQLQRFPEKLPGFRFSFRSFPQNAGT